MDDQKRIGTLGIPWDTNVVAALIVLAALAFLMLVRRGFRGFVVSL